ncbi:MAG: hypothetical protein Q9222_006085 [Ikaeria aurantiellina]
MAFSNKSLNHNDPGWLWKFIVRISAILTALLGIACVAFMYKWARDYPTGGEFSVTSYSRNIEQLSLSTLYSFLTLLLPILGPHLLPTTASFVCNTLLTLSLLASGIWLILAATTVIDNSSALALYLNDGIPHQYHASYLGETQAERRASIEIIGIVATFLAAYVARNFPFVVVFFIFHRILHSSFNSDPYAEIGQQYPPYSPRPDLLLHSPPQSPLPPSPPIHNLSPHLHPRSTNNEGHPPRSPALPVPSPLSEPQPPYVRVPVSPGARNEISESGEPGGRAREVAEL